MTRATARTDPVTPEAADLDGRLGALIGRAEEMMGHLGSETAELDLADFVDALRANRDGYRRCAASAFLWSEAFSAGREAERAEQAEAKRQAPRRGGHRAGRQGPLMRLLEGGKAAFVAVPAAFVAVARKARGTHLLGAHHVALAAAGTLAAGTVAAMTLLPSSQPAVAGGHVPGPVTPGGVTASADPFPSSSLAGHVRHAKTAAKGKRLPAAAGAGPSLYFPGPQPSASASASASASSVVSVQAGPAVLGQLGFATLDLSNPADTSVQFTLTAAGSGWLSWKITTDGTDLAFSPQSGVLKAGETATVTVSLASVLDSLTQQTFTVKSGPASDDQLVTVNLPLPVPAVVPSVSPSAVLPSL